MDTIKYCNVPLNYITPQIHHNGFISDTLNWTPITGTFVAGGNEKYMVLGNFKGNNATGTILINPTYSVTKVSDVYIDDVSVIELDLPAFAGKDTSCIPGTTIYIGRPRDVGIDEACKWYKLPVTITPTTPAIANSAGIWVSPTETTTYVVRQDICGMIKFDTVVVYKDGVGLEKLKMLNEELKIYPVPASDVLIIETQRHVDSETLSDGFRVQVINSLEQILREEKIDLKNHKAQIQTSDLPEGVYILHLKSGNSNTVSKRFVVAR